MPPGGPFGGGPPPEPKGNLRPLLDLVGLDWPSTEIVWNPYNPHPQLADLPPEIVFIGQRQRCRATPSTPSRSPVSGLQEIVTLFPGLLRPRSGGSGPEFIPLASHQQRRAEPLSWTDVAQQGFMGIIGINPRRASLRQRTSATPWPPG